MENRFFERPILNSPYKYPAQHWELDATGQPTQQIIENRRRAEFITPIPKPRKRKGAALQKGRLELFRNFDEQGNPFGRPRTLLIDSEQLESGEALDDNFRSMAADELDRFRREIIERTGDRRQAENLTDQEILREVMNTVGKTGRLGDAIRWAFAEFTEVYQIEAGFEARLREEFNKVVAQFSGGKEGAV